jgi:hypothetical protein
MTRSESQKQQLWHAPGSTWDIAITRVANPDITPAALTLRGDRLWTDFRRCVSFDLMYFGNTLLALGDEQLEDV